MTVFEIIIAVFMIAALSAISCGILWMFNTFWEFLFEESFAEQFCETYSPLIQPIAAFLKFIHGKLSGKHG